MKTGMQLRDGLKRLIETRAELHSDVNEQLNEVLKQVMGKNVTLQIHDPNDSLSSIFLNPDDEETSVAYIERIERHDDEFIAIPEDPDGNDERDEIELSDLCLDTRINLLDFLIRTKV